MESKQPAILLVEDEPIAQKVHRAMLEKFGCLVDLAATGEEALTKASNDPDLIFMDVGLPDISGINLTEVIRRRNDREQKHIPIIVLTAYSQPDIKQQCLAAGADAVFTKPVSLNSLKEILNKHIKIFNI